MESQLYSYINSKALTCKQVFMLKHYRRAFQSDLKSEGNHQKEDSETGINTTK